MTVHNHVSENHLHGQIHYTNPHVYNFIYTYTEVA
jgi:hypothetical protein